MDQGKSPECDPVVVVHTLREQARSLRQSATTMYAQADNLDAIAYEWEQALGEDGGQPSPDMGHDDPPGPGMRGGSRRR
jgi:hypothetical protein